MRMITAMRKNDTSFVQYETIGDLFEALGWRNNSWLNNRNDDAVKLYKEIICTQQLESTILDDKILDQMEEKLISKEQMFIFVQYAQHMRMGDIKSL